MRKVLLLLAVVASLLIVPAPALAAPPDFGTSVSTCQPDWYVNTGDETGRKPEQVAGGLKFEATDLVHRAVDRSVFGTTPGTFTLAEGSDSPDQPSFFSVEVRNPSGAYGTLRWNTSGTHVDKWSITIGAGTGPDGPATAGTFADANPVALLDGKVTKWGAFATGSNRVVSFGVGYTNSPPGTKAVIVESVTFLRRTYTMVCPPEPTQSASASASTSPTPPPSGQLTPVAALPITSSDRSPWGWVVLGALLVAGGSLAIWWGRRRTRTDA